MSRDTTEVEQFWIRFGPALAGRCSDAAEDLYDRHHLSVRNCGGEHLFAYRGASLLRAWCSRGLAWAAPLVALAS
jgi:hypothetical protein